jgi:hypothetical protein
MTNAVNLRRWTLPIKASASLAGILACLWRSADFLECGLVQGSFRLGKHAPYHQFEEFQGKRFRIRIEGRRVVFLAEKRGAFE